MATAVNNDIVVEAVGLTKVFSDFWLRQKAVAVDGISFEIRRDEIFGLLGPNGSGKSTTIKMILGLLHRSKGNLTVFGKDPTDVAVKRRICGALLTEGIAAIGVIPGERGAFGSYVTTALTAARGGGGPLIATVVLIAPEPMMGGTAMITGAAATMAAPAGTAAFRTMAMYSLMPASYAWRAS